MIWQRSYADPVSKEALQGYLENLPGVGPAMASSIIDTLGLDALSKIDSDPQLLLTVRAPAAISAPRTSAPSWTSGRPYRADRKNLLFLGGLGIGDATSRKISSTSGPTPSTSSRRTRTR